ncbi:MAG: FAD-binding protein [Desulfobulbaceae bacterium]|nr:MAG: FAD-binding protein [Desulfobulbaceae bacterium]
MITETFVQKMEEIVGASYVRKTGADLELYSYDASLVTGRPGLIVFPATTEEVSKVLKAAHDHGVPSVARGFATNLSGGTIISDGGLVISLSRFDEILGIYPESRYAVVQTGVTNLELQDALSPLGLFYAPDPASQKVSTIGGNVGENSGGPRCLKYGVTSNHILGMQMVMADGEVVEIGGPAFDPPGYDVRGLVVGSEGCVGIVTEITVRITPKTESVITMLAVYDAISDAAKTVSEIISTGIVPNTLEMMDNTIIQAVEKGGPCGYPTDAAAVLIIEVEGVAVGLKEQAEKIREICMATGCRDVKTAKNQAERDLLWKGRRGAFGAICNLSPNYLVNDGCVLRTKLPEALERVKAISDQYGCPVGNVFHAGDGNLHPLLMFDSRNEAEVEQVHKAGWDIMAVCAELGGTISGEHGIGHEKQDAMSMVFSGHDLNTQQNVKLALDPSDLMNPGKIIPLPPEGSDRLPDQEPTILKRPGGKDATGVSEAIEAIKQAKNENRAIRLAGSGSYNGMGNALTAEPVSINSLQMKEIIEYDTENQFITVGAGMSLMELQEKLAENNQWLPIRPPFCKPESTTGGIVAMAAVGPERSSYGAPRDMLLGLQYIDSNGQMVSTGGKVVKNVAGYDMTRLLTGSAGTLGLITEASWKIATRPEACQLASAVGSLEACATVAAEVIASNLLPNSVTAVQQNGDWQLMVGFEGIAGVVSYQIEQCLGLMSKAGLKDGAHRDYPVVEGCFTEIYATLEQQPFVAQSEVALGKVSQAYQKIEKICSPEAALIDFGCGRIFASFSSLDTTQWDNMNNVFSGAQGHGKLLKSTDDFRKGNDVYGLKKSEWQLTHMIKSALDPEGVFSPGALPGRA